MDDNYYKKYIKYKTKYINFRERQSGGGPPFGSLFSNINTRPATQAQLQARARDEDNIQLYKDLIQKYQALLFRLKYIYYKIEFSKYYSTNPSFIKEIQINIDEYIEKITAEIALLDENKLKIGVNKLENISFDKSLNVLHDGISEKVYALLQVLKQLDKFIEDTIIKQVSPEAENVKERYDDLYKLYADRSTELYNTLKDNPYVIQQDTYFKELLDIVQI
jgi:hypothetical protein